MVAHGARLLFSCRASREWFQLPRGRAKARWGYAFSFASFGGHCRRGSPHAFQGRRRSSGGASPEGRVSQDLLFLAAFWGMEGGNPRRVLTASRRSCSARMPISSTVVKKVLVRPVHLQSRSSPRLTPWSFGTSGSIRATGWAASAMYSPRTFTASTPSPPSARHMGHLDSGHQRRLRPALAASDPALCLSRADLLGADGRLHHRSPASWRPIAAESSPLLSLNPSHRTDFFSSPTPQPAPYPSKPRHESKRSIFPDAREHQLRHAHRPVRE